MSIFKTKINISKLILSFCVFVVLFSFIPNVTNATESYWFYNQGTYGETTVKHEIGSGTTGFMSKEGCELVKSNSCKTIGDSCSDCYLGNNIKNITFSPESGKYGDTITVNGVNIIEVKNILFGKINAPLFVEPPFKIGTAFNNPTPPADISRTITVKVPSGVVDSDSKITITTIRRGEATSDKNFVITSRDGEPGSQPPATPATPATETNYKLLAPLPGLINFESDPGINPCPFGKYMNIMIKLIIGIASVLAVIMIMKGGFEYMTSSLPSGKESGRGTITQAILGLLIALGAYLLLYTINPNLLNFCLDQQLPNVEIKISPEQELMIKNRSGGGNCEVVTNTASACHPNNMVPFANNTTWGTYATAPFNKLAAQASAICQLESNAVSDAPQPAGTGSGLTIDLCKNDKTIFSFGLFQINILANGASIKPSAGQDCGNLFEIPGGGNYIVQNPAAPGGYEYNCNLKNDAATKTRYTSCKNYLINPVNNINEAYRMWNLRQPRWKDWSTYSSCKNKF